MMSFTNSVGMTPLSLCFGCAACVASRVPAIDLKAIFWYNKLTTTHIITFSMEVDLRRDFPSAWDTLHTLVHYIIYTSVCAGIGELSIFSRDRKTVNFQTYLQVVPTDVGYG